jgi:NAD(P)-dependent dehydrogenase (short-subunit alcohol dehydrogenase family)
MTLKDRKIIIVGGRSGIGWAVAEAAAAEGARVTIASSDPAGVSAAADRLGNGARGVVVDVTDAAAVQQAFSDVTAVDHLVFTAGDWGGFRRAPVAELDLQAARALFAVRFWGALAVVQALQGRMAAGGSITLTDGMIAHRPSPGAAVSSAMAGAVEHLVRGLAVELAPLRVNGVCPGLIRTGVWDRIAADAREEQFRRMTARQPLPRIGEPDEVAQAYLYLMRAGYTTGQVLKVDGGSSVV